jgi:ectoine hydroxylase-related dioxygenase (phytanoyl-CoA dioxygenase family)
MTVERFEGNAGRLPPAFNMKAHLLFPLLWEMVRDPRIVDPVEDLLGPDILCFGTSFISKSGRDERYVSWHQDATHWGLTSAMAITAWVAFTASNRANGCVRVLPGTHKSVLKHENMTDENNMLGRKEFVVEAVDETQAVDLALEPGEMSLHHALIVHGSETNRSGDRRLGFAIRYIPASTGHVSGRRSSATLVRGADQGTFDLEKAPEDDLHPDAIRRHRDVLRSGMSVIFDKRMGDGTPAA